MKQLSIFLFFATFSLAQAQEYQPTFVNEKNQWHEAFCGVIFFNGEITCNLIRSVFRDTMHLNGQIYHKRYRSYPTNYDSLSFANALYREDSVGNVYLVDVFDNTFSEEALIYKFNVETGDTVSIERSPERNLKVIVTAIDSISLLSGERRKRLTVSSLSNQQTSYWVEGIGSDYGTMDTRLMFLVDGWIELACYQYDGEIEYETALCDLRTSTRELAKVTFAKVFPNPFISEILIQTNVNESLTLQLFDAIGKLVSQSKINTPSFPLNTANLPTGLYHLRLQDEMGNFQIEKLVKM